MSSVVADTHAIIWYLREPTLLSAPALAALDQAATAPAQVHVASITLVETRYLIEKGRVDASVFDRLVEAVEAAAPVIRLVPLDLAVARRLADVPRGQVPDMPDRIIAATALHLGLPLVSRDRKIQASSVTTIW